MFNNLGDFGGYQVTKEMINHNLQQVDLQNLLYNPNNLGDFGGYQVTKEMINHNLQQVDLQNLLYNPKSTNWTLSVPPSVQLYADLQQVLKKRRILAQDIRMIYRSMDSYLKQSTTENIGAYRMVTDIIRKSTEKGVVVNYDHHSKFNQCEHP